MNNLHNLTSYVYGFFIQEHFKMGEEKSLPIKADLALWIHHLYPDQFYHINEKKLQMFLFYLRKEEISC